MSADHLDGAADRRHPNAPTTNLAELATEIANYLIEAKSAFHLLEAQLIDRGRIRYTVQAPDGGKLVLTITDPGAGAGDAR
ncbi:hypothetical protein AB0B45_18380 [Nonomuraea sp. NPDC049152]|uniref:hypothetical protein n=1 Tax=Nonomuraea sp. NPDC049152 TaxID=3154350 RepID=UPI0033C31F11